MVSPSIDIIRGSRRSVLKADSVVVPVANRASAGTERVLMLTPSRGLGGGIERYAETVESAFGKYGIEYCRADLAGSGPMAHARLLLRSRELLRADSRPARVVLLHKGLLLVGSLLARDRCVSGISVICHGAEVWTRQPVRGRLEKYLMRRPGVQVVAVSSFTAGALVGICPAGVLPPGLSPEWFETLIKAAATDREPHPGIQIVTAFRLADWQDKGLPELMEAIAMLDRRDVSLTICGSGEPPGDLWAAVRACAWCTLLPGLSERELARQYAVADLCVLATRTRSGQRACGEGFGMTLLEAQVAGTPVVGPARGGSADAFVDRVTGITPVDESAQALADALREVLQDPQHVQQMGQQAAVWARERFAPERYARAVTARLL
jgi:phosphatidylinositol alpha-1,6-mannosyltransferase